MTGLTVWWHGIGSRSHVQLAGGGSSSKGEAAGGRVDLTTDGAKLIRDYDTRCLEVPDAAFFESGSKSFVIGSGSEELMTGIEAAIRSAPEGRSLSRIDVEGHADPMPVPKSTNELLALERAQQVAEKLKTFPVLLAFFGAHPKGEALRVSSAGARRPVQMCKAEGTQAMQRQCNAMNRRVEIRLHFAKPIDKVRSAGP